MFGTETFEGSMQSRHSTLKEAMELAKTRSEVFRGLVFVVMNFDRMTRKAMFLNGNRVE